jgi:hypothetical protein
MKKPEVRKYSSQGIFKTNEGGGGAFPTVFKANSDTFASGTV